MPKDINEAQKSIKSLKKYRFYMLFSRNSIYLQVVYRIRRQWLNV